MQRSDERAPVQHGAGVGAGADEVQQRYRDLVIDALGQRGLELRVDPDVGDHEALEGRGLKMLWQASRVLDGKTLQGRATVEDGFDPYGEVLLDVGQILIEAAQLGEFHTPGIASSGPALSG